MASVSRLFQSLAPLNEDDFYPLYVLFFGSFKSVLRSCRVASCEFLVKISFIYGGAILLIDLYTIVLLSCLIMSFTVFQPRFWISGLLEASKLLLVMILAALL